MKEYIDCPTITKLSMKEKNDYKISHINVLDLLRRIEMFEQQAEEYKKSESALMQKISDHENEINRLKIICSELEKKSAVLIKEQKKTVNAGEIIKFGRYEGKDIEWRILDINQKDNSVLLISKYLLFEKKYNETKGDCTWETSTIRRYLNNEFYRNSFNEEEKRKIKEEIVDNIRYRTEEENDIRNKVFLLSIDEVQSYYKTKEERKTALIGEEASWYYWLRSLDASASHTACIDRDGLVVANGFDVDYDGIGVRPALWINL